MASVRISTPDDCRAKVSLNTDFDTTTAECRQCGWEATFKTTKEAMNVAQAHEMLTGRKPYRIVCSWLK